MTSPRDIKIIKTIFNEDFLNAVKHEKIWERFIYGVKSVPEFMEKNPQYREKFLQAISNGKTDRGAYDDVIRVMMSDVMKEMFGAVMPEPTRHIGLFTHEPVSSPIESVTTPPSPTPGLK